MNLNRLHEFAQRAAKPKWQRVAAQITSLGQAGSRRLRGFVIKDDLFRLAQSTKPPVEARNQAREYLQALILQSLQRAGAMTMLAFHGGTALRFLYSLPRYSEDLGWFPGL